MKKSIKENLLNLAENEIAERKKARKDYYYYKGRSVDLDKAKIDEDLYGQNWKTEDNLDYIPTQEIRNKIKPLLKKQARFMFGIEPTITFKPDNNSDKEKFEELRKFIDDIFEDNQFWKETRKAFLMSTIKKRVLLRLEINENTPIKLKYENIDDFSYKEINGRLEEVMFFEEDRRNVYAEKEDDKIYYVHKYFYKKAEESNSADVWYIKSTFKGSDLKTPIEEILMNTGFGLMPCWLVKNGGELNEQFGESDIDDIRDIQNQYNRRISDFADALRFQLFGATAIVDGNADNVNDLTIAPGALNAIKTDKEALEEGKQATIQRQEFNFGSSEAINSYLDRASRDINMALDMPDVKDLVNIPSGKAMKYMYNDLIARCEEKWSDWEPILKEAILYIINAGSYSYKNLFKKEWNTLDFTIIFKHNYPIPSDEEDSKRLAIEEVVSEVRSRQSYIRDFTDEESPDTAFNEILKEKSLLEGVSMGEFSGKAKEDINE